MACSGLVDYGVVGDRSLFADILSQIFSHLVPSNSREPMMGHSPTKIIGQKEVSSGMVAEGARILSGGTAHTALHKLTAGNPICVTYRMVAEVAENVRCASI